MPKFQLQKLMQENPLIDMIERKANEMENGIPIEEYDNWLLHKRQLGKKKLNRPISRNKRRIAIKKKQFGYNQN